MWHIPLQLTYYRFGPHVHAPPRRGGNRAGHISIYFILILFGGANTQEPAYADSFLAVGLATVLTVGQQVSAAHRDGSGQLEQQRGIVPVTVGYRRWLPPTLPCSRSWSAGHGALRTFCNKIFIYVDMQRLKMTHTALNITILAGITGINKNQFTKNLIKKSNCKKSVLCLDFEKELINEERDPPLQTPNMPDFLDNPNAADKARMLETNFSWLGKKIENRDASVTDVLLSMHLVYYKNSEFFLTFMLNQFLNLTKKQATPKFNIITLTDDVFTIWQNLHSREEKFPNTSLRLKEILTWRSLEYLYALSLKNYLNGAIEEKQETANEIIPKATSYLVSVRHPFSTFYNLIFKQQTRRIYLSYPITRTRRNPDYVSDINNFRKHMHAAYSHNSVIFDPVTIDELSLNTALNETTNQDKSTPVLLKKSHRWPLELDNILVDDLAWPIKIPRDEIIEAKRDIDNQIVSRDYTLVDSAKTIAVYRPYLGGAKSEGVDAEIKHAKEYSKKVVVYNPKSDMKNLSTHPFGSKVTLFATKREFYKHLRV